MTGSFILIDPVSNNTVAAGMIRGEAREIDDLLDVTSTEQETRRQRLERLSWEAGALTQAEREKLNGHEGAVLWFTGLVASGKSTIAKQLERSLYQRGIHTMFLDNDMLRQGLNSDLSFSPEDRAENIRRVSEVAAIGYSCATIVLCCFISPYCRDREYARGVVPEGRFFEIYTKCDIDVLKRRDPLYAKALRGEIKHFTGITAPYEEPTNPEMVVETDVESPDVIVGRLLKLLEDAKIIPAMD
jgi:bifunctional enzyme CysN/CysC